MAIAILWMSTWDEWMRRSDNLHSWRIDTAHITVIVHLRRGVARKAFRDEEISPLSANI